MFAETEKVCEQNGMVLVAKQKQQKRRGENGIYANISVYHFTAIMLKVNFLS